jgi:hypothetical protein
MKKIHGPELEDPMLVPFNVDGAYVVGGGTPHRRYVNVSIMSGSYTPGTAGRRL